MLKTGPPRRFFQEFFLSRVSMRQILFQRCYFDIKLTETLTSNNLPALKVSLCTGCCGRMDDVGTLVGSKIRQENDCKAEIIDPCQRQAIGQTHQTWKEWF